MIKRDFLPINKSCSFIKFGKPTITSTTMQEHHDNDEIEPHNHNECPLLYKEEEISTSGLGKFLECRKCDILLVTCALVIYLICMLSGIHIRHDIVIVNVALVQTSNVYIVTIHLAGNI